MQTHFPERGIAAGGESRALWALEPDHTVVVFVHGYGGDAVATWSEFDTFLPARAACAHADIIFYGYNAVRSNVIAAASLLAEFLEDLSNNAPVLINKGLPDAAHRHESFRHHRLILIGHSLGAVIIRWALLFVHERQSTWLGTTRMALFAPAHTGANVVNLVLSATMGFPVTIPFLKAFQFFSPLVEELRPESDILRNLQERTKTALADGSRSLRPVRVAIAEFENVVNNLPFQGDPPPVVFAGANHVSICKPKAGFARPVDIVAECL